MEKTHILGYRLKSGGTYITGSLETHTNVLEKVHRQISLETKAISQCERSSGATWMAIHIDDVIPFLKGQGQPSYITMDKDNPDPAMFDHPDRF
jgi:hypothetical protein